MNFHLTWPNQVGSGLNKRATNYFVPWHLPSEVSLHLFRMYSYYFADVHSSITSGVSCWGNYSRVCTILILQKRIRRTLFLKHNTYSCKNLFTILRILLFPSIYVLSFLRFLKNIICSYYLKREGYKNYYNLRPNLDFPFPDSRLSLKTKSIVVMPLRIYNKLLSKIRELCNYVCKCCQRAKQKHFTSSLRIS